MNKEILNISTKFILLLLYIVQIIFSSLSIDYCRIPIILTLTVSVLCILSLILECIYIYNNGVASISSSNINPGLIIKNSTFITFEIIAIALLYDAYNCVNCIIIISIHSVLILFQLTCIISNIYKYLRHHNKSKSIIFNPQLNFDNPVIYTSHV